MAKRIGTNILGGNSLGQKTVKGTSIGRGKIKTSSMNKATKRGYKGYRGQG